jgi:hypothetical protein
MILCLSENSWTKKTIFNYRQNRNLLFFLSDAYRDIHMDTTRCVLFVVDVSVARCHHHRSVGQTRHMPTNRYVHIGACSRSHSARIIVSVCATTPIPHTCIWSERDISPIPFLTQIILRLRLLSNIIHVRKTEQLLTFSLFYVQVGGNFHLLDTMHL